MNNTIGKEKGTIGELSREEYNLVRQELGRDLGIDESIDKVTAEFESNGKYTMANYLANCV